MKTRYILLLSKGCIAGKQKIILLMCKQQLDQSHLNMQFFLSNLETLVRHGPLKESLLWLNCTATLQGKKSMALEGADNRWEQQNQASTLP